VREDDNVNVPIWASETIVLYGDDNMRLKPHPPVTLQDACFGSSVIIGSAPIAERPFVDIATVSIDPISNTFTITYANGSTAQAQLSVNRTTATVGVNV